MRRAARAGFYATIFLVTLLLAATASAEAPDTSVTAEGQPRVAQGPAPVVPLLMRPGWVGGSLGTELAWVVGPGALLFAGSRVFPQSTAGRSNTAATYDSRASSRSDYTGFAQGTAFALGAGVAFEALHLGGLVGDWLYTPMVAAEAAMYASALGGFIKRAVGRCRPLAWNDMTQECDTSAPSHASGLGGEEALRAFPSGHVTPIAGAGAAYTTLAIREALQGDVSPSRFVAAGVVGTLTGVTMHYRVASGAHSATDVWGGLALGSAVGALLAWIHPLEPVAPTEPGAAIRWRVVPHAGGLSVAGEL